MQRIVDSIGSPATVSNMRGDCLLANALGRALYAPLFDSRSSPTGRRPPRIWSPRCAQKGGRNPYDRALTDLIGQLSTRSEPFRKWWAAHNVRYYQTGRNRLHHPTVADFELDYEVMELSADSGLQRRARQPFGRGARPPRELDRDA